MGGDGHTTAGGGFEGQGEWYKYLLLHVCVRHPIHSGLLARVTRRKFSQRVFSIVCIALQPERLPC